MDSLSQKWVTFSCPEARPEFSPSSNDLRSRPSGETHRTHLSRRAEKIRRILERLDIRINPAADLRSNTKRRHDLMVSRYLGFSPDASVILATFLRAVFHLRLWPNHHFSLPNDLAATGALLVDYRSTLALLLAPPIALSSDLFDSTETARLLKLFSGQSVDLPTLLDVILGSDEFGSLESPSLRGLAEISTAALAKKTLTIMEIASSVCKSRWFDNYPRVIAEKIVTLASNGEGEVDLVVLAVVLIVPNVFLGEFDQRIEYLASRQATSEQDRADRIQFRLTFHSTKMQERSDSDWHMTFDSFDRTLTGKIEVKSFVALNNKFATIIFGKKEAEKRYIEIPDREYLESIEELKELCKEHSNTLPFTVFTVLDTYFRYLVAGNIPAVSGVVSKPVFVKAVLECNRFVPVCVLASDDPVHLVFGRPMDRLDFLSWAEVICYQPKEMKPLINEMLLADVNFRDTPREKYDDLKARIFTKAPKAWDELGTTNKWDENLKKSVQRFFNCESSYATILLEPNRAPTVITSPSEKNKKKPKKITRLSDSVIEVDV